LRRGSAVCCDHDLTVRALLTRGRVFAAFALVLLALVGTRIGELQPLEGGSGTLIAIDSATVYETDHPPQFSTVQLPVRHFREHRELTRLRAVSQFELEKPTGDLPWVLYAESLHDGGRLKINGRVIADLPVTDADTTVRQLRPLRFEIPAELLHSGTNVLEREWAVHENLLLMPQMAIGDAQSINALFRPRNIAYRVLPKVTFVVALALAFIMFSIYLRSPELKAYLWVALSSLGFCVVDLLFLVNAIPSAVFPFWQVVIWCAGSALTLGTNYFLLNISGVDAPRYRLWTFSLSVLQVGAFMAYCAWTGNTYALVFTRTSVLMSALFAVYPLFALVRSLLNQFQWRKAVLLLVATTTIWIGVLDMTTDHGSRSAVQSGYLLQVYALVWFTASCAFLIVDFSQSLTAQRAQATTLADELATQKSELSRLHAMERASQEAQAAAVERGRIMQDMHDGLGSQLVSSLVMARAGELTSLQTYELLRSCIDDLRLAIDTSHDSQDSLQLALGNLRFRMQPRLKAAGIALHWETQRLTNPLSLRPQDQLPVLRIIQESLANALKHANAKTITVEASNTDTLLTVRIEDDGHGFDVEAAQAQATGKGLNSLNKRTRVLGGQLQITSSVRGSRITVTLPLNRHTLARTPGDVEATA
jgi:signal transduction histidine kinase